LKRWIDRTLWLLFLASVVAVVLGMDDPFARRWICERIRSCPAVRNADAWKKLIYDFGVAGLTSLIFYGLLVRLPEFERRRRIKSSLREHYRHFKRGCISTIVGVVERTYSTKMADELIDQKKFRAYFKPHATESQNKWHVFRNRLQSHNLSDLLATMEVFRGELLFVLNNTDVANEETFDVLKRLTAALTHLQRTNLDDDSAGQLCGFLWEILAGWSSIEGYQDEDFVEKMIRSI
jgi:hypothetical protein